MATQLTGRAEIFLNGSVVRAIGGAKLTLGGEVRETVQGAFGPAGYKVSGVNPGAVEWEEAHGVDTDLSALDAAGVTVQFHTDTGSVFLVNNAVRIGDPLEIDGENGTIPVRFEGDPAVQVS